MKYQLIIISCFIAFYLFLNNKVAHVYDISTTEVSQVDPLPCASPNFTKDISGNTVLSWVKLLNDTSAIFCYTLFKNGKSIGETMEVEPSKNIYPHSENAPKLIFKPSGEIIAVWTIKNPGGAKKYSGGLNYSQSFDNGKTWSEATRMVKDIAEYNQPYADVTLFANVLQLTSFTSLGISNIRTADNDNLLKMHDDFSRQGKHPQHVSLPDNEVVIVWDEAVQIGKNYYKRIGMQVRTADGFLPINEFITSDTLYSTYPVVAAVDNNNVLVAYTSRENKKGYIKWQQVLLNR